MYSYMYSTVVQYVLKRVAGTDYLSREWALDLNYQHMWHCSNEIGPLYHKRILYKMGLKLHNNQVKKSNYKVWSLYGGYPTGTEYRFRIHYALHSTT